MQNLIVLMEPCKDAHDISLKGGRLFFNRFCIDKDAACELSGVYDLKESSSKLARFAIYADRSDQVQKDINAKGKLWSIFWILEQIISSIIHRRYPIYLVHNSALSIRY